MKQSEFTTRVLTPEEGHILTQADDATELSRRIFSGKVYLASGDSPEAWHEITDAEAEALQAEQAAAMEAEVAAVAARLEADAVSTQSSRSSQSTPTEGAGAQEGPGSTRSSQISQSTLMEDTGAVEAQPSSAEHGAAEAAAPEQK